MYAYAAHRKFVFTEEGQITFLKIRDNAEKLIAASGAASCERIMSVASGDSWEMLACVDRLVELGELMEVPNTYSKAGQNRLFISGRHP